MQQPIILATGRRRCSCSGSRSMRTIVAVVVYRQWIAPSRAPMVETLVIKPTVNVTNPALLSATGYRVADKQSRITPKISGKVVKLNFDVGDKVTKG